MFFKYFKCCLWSRSEAGKVLGFFHLSGKDLQDRNAAVLHGKDFSIVEEENYSVVRTGDLAKITKSGVLFLGRNELTVKVSGDSNPSLFYSFCF